MAKKPSHIELTGLELLSRLNSGDRVNAWRRFLDKYSPLIVHIAGQKEYEQDQTNDCYLFICEKLCENNFRRLFCYKPEGSASFRSWLNVVIANLCIDWRRKRLGRERPFASIARLPRLDQLAFKYKFQRSMSLQTCLERMQVEIPGLSEPQLASAVTRVSSLLTSKQHWILSTRQPTTVPLESEDPVAAGPGPEQSAEHEQYNKSLQRALGLLTPRQRLLIKLRYQQDLSLKEVARLMRIGDPFRARRQIQVALAELAIHLEN